MTPHPYVKYVMSWGLWIKVNIKVCNSISQTLVNISERNLYTYVLAGLRDNYFFLKQNLAFVLVLSGWAIFGVRISEWLIDHEFSVLLITILSII